MIPKANHIFGMFPPMICFDNDSVKNLDQYCLGAAFLFTPSLYRALKLTLNLDIGGLSVDDTTKSEMCTGSIGQRVGVFTPALLNAEGRP